MVTSSQVGKMVMWDSFTTNKECAVAMTSKWVVVCAYAPAGHAIACGSLDNKCSVYLLTFDKMKAWLPKRSLLLCTPTICPLAASPTRMCRSPRPGATAQVPCGRWRAGGCCRAFHGHGSTWSVWTWPPSETWTTFFFGGCDKNASWVGHAPWTVRAGLSNTRI